MIQRKLIQIGGVQIGEKYIFKFLTESKKYQVIISSSINSDKEYIDKVIEYKFEGGEKILNPAGFDFLSTRGKGEFLIFKNRKESFKEIWSEIFTF
jgi:hypothetical protein